jgi:hypothetical protein
MSMVTLSFVITGWLGKFSTCSRRSIRVVDDEVTFLFPVTSASK